MIHVQRGIALIILILSSCLNAAAFDASNPPHIPPKPEDLRSYFPLALESKGLKKARVLISGPSGYTIHPMELEDTVFVSRFFGKDLDGRNYEFQVETEDGQILETRTFSIASTGARAESKTIEDLTKELSNVKAEEGSLNTRLDELTRVTESELQTRKNEEFAKALLILGKRERELAALKERK